VRRSRRLDEAAWRAAERYVAGRTREEALETVARLEREGLTASIDFFGQSVGRRTTASSGSSSRSTPASDGLPSPTALTVWPKDREVSENVADLVFRRTRLRTRLGLPASDCAARKPNPDCSCLTTTLDELGEHAIDREAVLAAARKRHAPRRPIRHHRPKPNRPPRTVPPVTVKPPPAAELVTETATRRDVRPRFRRRHTHFQSKPSVAQRTDPRPAV
jgi:hypothetical protein